MTRLTKAEIKANELEVSDRRTPLVSRIHCQRLGTRRGKCARAWLVVANAHNAR